MRKIFNGVSRETPLILLLLVFALLVGCTTPPVTKEVKVPVAVRAMPPAELLAPVSTDPLPVFVKPTDANATSALTPQGERRLKQLLLELFTRTLAWEAWATSGEKEE